MILIDTERLPHHLNDAWTRDTGKALRILFWAAFVFPFLSSLGEFWVRMLMQLVGAKNADAWAIRWAQFAPLVTLVATTVGAAALWKLTTAAHLERTGRHPAVRALRPLFLLWWILCAVNAASALSGFRLSSELYLWLTEICWTATAVLIFLRMGALADHIDQYPIQALTRVMIFYVISRILTRLLGILLAGTDVGAVVNPVLAMGELALSLVTIAGFLMVVGRLHRVTRLVSAPPKHA
jgi:hypothetical protein